MTMTGPLCVAVEGCPDIGVFPYRREATDGTIVEGLACFAHDSVLNPAPVAGVAPASPATVDGTDAGDAATPSADVAGDVPSFHEDVTLGLASVLLEHAAMAMLDDDDATARAMASLAANLGMDADVAAGFLLAASYLIAAGGLTDVQVTAGAELYEQQADDLAGAETADTADTTAAAPPGGADGYAAEVLDDALTVADAVEAHALDAPTSDAVGAPAGTTEGATDQ